MRFPRRSVIVAAVALTLAGAGCGSTGGSHPSSGPTSAASTAPKAPAPSATTPAPAPATTTPATTTPATTTPATTTPATTPATTTPATTTTLPADPQPSADAAAADFIDGWKSGARGQAQRVATKRAVTSLFAHAYKGQNVIDRGCSDQFLPVVCSYGPYGGGSGALYEVNVRPKGAKWYVSSVIIEG